MMFYDLWACQMAGIVNKVKACLICEIFLGFLNIMPHFPAMFKVKINAFGNLLVFF